MMMKCLEIVTLIIATFFSSTLFGQAILGSQSLNPLGNPANHPSCGSHDLMRIQDQLSPGVLDQNNALLQTIVLKINEEKQFKSYTQRYIVPVVFHVVHNTVAENLPDSVLYNQLDIMNASFRRQNADTVNMRPEFSSIVGDAQIEFVLADTDPNGSPTNGIVRTYSTIEHFGGILPYGQGQNALISQWVNDSLFPNIYRITKTANGGSDAWDPSRYLNVWIGDLRILEPQFNNFEEIVFFGVASPPELHPNWSPTVSADLGITEQGVVMHYVTIGGNNQNTFPAPYQAYNNLVRQGKMLVHEVGHYLGLRHIWGDGDCTVDDFIDDTPNADASSSYNCNQSLNTCFDDINGVDLHNMIENYMDYSSSYCQNSFTIGQIDVMREVLFQYRENLAQTVLLGVENQQTLDSGFSIAPNPSNGEFAIDLKDQRQQVLISVFNNLGQLEAQRAYTNENTILLSLELKAGVYFLQLQIDEKAPETTRIIVQ